MVSGGGRPGGVIERIAAPRGAEFRAGVEILPNRPAGHKRTCSRGRRLRQQSSPCQDAKQRSQTLILAHKSQNCTGYPLLCLPAKTGRFRAEFVAVLA